MSKATNTSDTCSLVWSTYGPHMVHIWSTYITNDQTYDWTYDNLKSRPYGVSVAATRWNETEIVTDGHRHDQNDLKWVRLAWCCKTWKWSEKQKLGSALRYLMILMWFVLMYQRHSNTLWYSLLSLLIQFFWIYFDLPILKFFRACKLDTFAPGCEIPPRKSACSRYLGPRSEKSMNHGEPELEDLEGMAENTNSADGKWSQSGAWPIERWAN